jgi:uncharacterized membrane protein
MELLWTAGACIGLWLLFPKGFKYVVGSMVGSMGAMFFWGLFIVAWCMAIHSPSWAFMGWSMVVFLILGNIGGCILAAKG